MLRIMANILIILPSNITMQNYIVHLSFVPTSLGLIKIIFIYYRVFTKCR